MHGGWCQHASHGEDFPSVMECAPSGDGNLAARAKVRSGDQRPSLQASRKPQRSKRGCRMAMMTNSMLQWVVLLFSVVKRRSEDKRARGRHALRNRRGSSALTLWITTPTKARRMSSIFSKQHSQQQRAVDSGHIRHKSWCCAGCVRICGKGYVSGDAPRSFARGDCSSRATAIRNEKCQ